MQKTPILIRGNNTNNNYNANTLTTNNQIEKANYLNSNIAFANPNTNILTVEQLNQNQTTGDVLKNPTCNLNQQQQNLNLYESTSAVNFNFKQ